MAPGMLYKGVMEVIDTGLKHAKFPAKVWTYQRHASKSHASFALCCVLYIPPRRAYSTSREANIRISMVFCTASEVPLSTYSSEIHYTAPICIAEPGLRDFRSRHLCW